MNLDDLIGTALVASMAPLALVCLALFGFVGLIQVRDWTRAAVTTWRRHSTDVAHITHPRIWSDDLDQWETELTKENDR